MVPIPQTFLTVCGHRYQEGTPSAGATPTLCTCGLVGIGVCTSCGAWFCGDCMTGTATSRLCRACGAPARREAEALRWKQVQARNRAAEAAADIRERERREALQCRQQIPEQHKRLKVLVQALNAAGNPGASRSGHRQKGLFGKAITTAYWPVGSYIWLHGDATPVPLPTVVTVDGQIAIDRENGAFDPTRPLMQEEDIHSIVARLEGVAKEHNVPVAPPGATALLTSIERPEHGPAVYRYAKGELPSPGRGSAPPTVTVPAPTERPAPTRSALRRAGKLRDKIGKLARERSRLESTYGRGSTNPKLIRLNSELERLNAELKELGLPR